MNKDIPIVLITKDLEFTRLFLTMHMVGDKAAFCYSVQSMFTGEEIDMEILNFEDIEVFCLQMLAVEMHNNTYSDNNIFLQSEKDILDFRHFMLEILHKVYTIKFIETTAFFMEN